IVTPPPTPTLLPYTTLFRSPFPQVRRGRFCGHHALCHNLLFPVEPEQEPSGRECPGHQPDQIPGEQYDESIGGYEEPVHRIDQRSEEHTSELQSRENLVCRL